MANKFIDQNGLRYFFTKIKRMFEGKADKSDLKPVATSGKYGDLDEKPVIDTSVVEGSINAVSGGAVYDSIESVKSLIDNVTTTKVNVADIIDNLTTNVSNKPLSAAQGVVLKSLIDAIVIPTIPSSLPANGGNADTVDNKHVVVSSSVPTNNDTSVITFVI